MLQSGDQEAWGRSLSYLYAADALGVRQKIIAYVMKQGGSSNDAQDICHDAFIVAERNLREGVFRQESSLVTYIVAIGKGMWQNKQRQNKRLIFELETPLSHHVEKSVEEYFLSQERQELIHSAINSLPERCREVMAMSALGFLNREITEALELRNGKQTENKLVRCRKLLRSILQKMPL